MKVALVTVSDDRMGRKGGVYQKTQYEIIEKLKPFNIIDEFYTVTWEDIRKTDFYEHNKILLDHIDASKNGRAYKPFAINQVLSKLDEGDILIYQDCSPEMWSMEYIGGNQNHLKKVDIHNLDKLLDRCNGIIAPFVNWDNRPNAKSKFGIHTHENFTTDLCISFMQAQQFRRSFQCASGMVIFRKTSLSGIVVDLWEWYNTIDKCCAMGSSYTPEDFSYWDKEQDKKMGHRHDQSILGLLMNKYQPMLINPINIYHPYVFLNYCMTNYNTIELIDSNYNPEPIREINKGDKVLNNKGVELTVFEIWPESNDGPEVYEVGIHRQSKFKAYRHELTKVI